MVCDVGIFKMLNFSRSAKVDNITMSSFLCSVKLTFSECQVAHVPVKVDVLTMSSSMRFVKVDILEM